MTRPALAADRAAVAATVHNVIREILPGVPASEISGEGHLSDLGADSVDRVEIIFTLIDRLALDAPMSAFSELSNIDALIDFLVRSRRS